MKITEAIKRAVGGFRRISSPLDWLEFGAFALIAVGAAGLIVWALVTGLVEALKEQDWLKAIASLVPLLLLSFAVIRSVLTRRVHWILIAFTAAASGIAYYFLYV
ncbi:hypothetical protein MYX65_05650 [Acidobacteria bacterium AH-259-L09]|nr:hypothetical protein [Acidobacteria bacterium AH-259-L09]